MALLRALAAAALAATALASNECSVFQKVVDGIVVTCSGHGVCTSQTKHCECYEGFGSSAELSQKLQPPHPAPDCSEMVCPFGKSWGDIPTSATQAHAEVECSDAGYCDRALGVCSCFAGYAGSACDRRSCKMTQDEDEAQCSGHGQCLTLAELATKADAQPLTPATSYGGYPTTTTWDEDMITSCYCDSVWTVGLASGQTQLSEYFGAYCEKRRCPSGNDPMTDADETDCEAKIQDFISGAISDDVVNGGAAGNLCHVDCSNRGICDYETGTCNCFTGYTGENCAFQDTLAVQA